MVGGDGVTGPRVSEGFRSADPSGPSDVRELPDLDPWPPRPSLNALQRARLASGLSQGELAAELSISRQTVSSIENHRRTPSVRLALAFATALNATVEELFAGDERR